MALTARISPISDHIVAELVDSTGKTKIEIIEEALKSYRFHERMRQLNAEYLKLRANKKIWAQELKEREELEGTLTDGLDDY